MGGSTGCRFSPHPPLPVRSVGFLVVVWHKNSCHHWITWYIKIWSIQYQLISQYFSTYLVCSLEKAFFFFFSVELGLHPPIINSRIPSKAYGELKPFLSSFKILSMVLKKVCLKIKWCVRNSSMNLQPLPVFLLSWPVVQDFFKVPQYKWTIAAWWTGSKHFQLRKILNLSENERKSTQCTCLSYHDYYFMQFPFLYLFKNTVTDFN